MTFILFETGSAKWLRKITDDPKRPVQWTSDHRKATEYSHAASLAEAVADMGVQQYAATIIPHTEYGEPFPPIPARPRDFPLGSSPSSRALDVFRAIVRRNPHWAYLVGEFEKDYTLMVRRGEQLTTVKEWYGTALAEINNTIGGSTMDFAEEDAIIAQAKAIKSKAFRDAEARWEALPDSEKKRPWPRCGSLQCNRTLVCHHGSDQRCQGFEF